MKQQNQKPKTIDDEFFIEHIRNHFKEEHPDWEVVCKICGKSAKEIIGERNQFLSEKIGNFWEKFHQNPEYNTILSQIENVSTWDNYTTRVDEFEKILKKITELIMQQLKKDLGVDIVEKKEKN